MRALLPSASDTEVDVHEWYSRDWLEPGGLRVNFVSSVDGGVTASGRSQGLQTPGDNRIFAALRDLADVVLAGAGTVRDEGYQAIRLSERRQNLRRELGLSPVLPTALISRSLDLDPSSPLFAEDAPARTIVITMESANRAARDALSQVADVIIAGEGAVDLTAARDGLAERGLSRILCEGGPRLFAGLVEAGAADELCLSTSALLVGPDSRRIVGGAPWGSSPRPLRLTALLTEDDALFARYRLDAPPPPPPSPGTMSSSA